MKPAMLVPPQAPASARPPTGCSGRLALWWATARARPSPATCSCVVIVQAAAGLFGYPLSILEGQRNRLYPTHCLGVEAVHGT
eukprot:scaffold155158_cov20-Tisochrysis_lutea.AAC.4